MLVSNPDELPVLNGPALTRPHSRKRIRGRRVGERMLRLLAGLTLLLTGADHWTTYLCLRAPVNGWEVIEANPLAGWLFSIAGLVPGLVIDSAITLSAVGFLILTPRFPTAVKAGLLVFIISTTGYAVINNLTAMRDLGLLPPGVS